MENIPPPDANNLRLTFQNTFSPAAELRKQAEELLQKWEKVPGFAVNLLQLASAEVDISERQAAAVCLKNFCKRKWEAKADQIPEADKNIIRENLIDVLINSPPKVRSVISTVITDISFPDFPNKWPSFLPKVGALIASQNPHAIHGALLALQRAVKKYQYMNAGDDRRAPLDAIVKEVFPTLLQIFTVLGALDTAESGLIVKLVCKIIESTTKMAMPAPFADPAVFGAWMPALVQSLERPIPDSVLPADPEEKAKHPLWQVKKWIARIFERFIKRYGVVHAEDHSVGEQFKGMFIQAYATRVMGAALQVLSLKRAGQFLSDRVAQSLIAYLAVCVRHGVTFVALKPHLQTLTQEILFPYLYLSDKDMELWQDDPHEYMRKESDFMEEFFHPRNASINFLSDLITYRGKDHLHQFMAFVVSVLGRYEATPAATRHTDVNLVRAKDGGLVVIGTFAPFLKRLPEYSNNLERMIIAHVFPELTSPVGFLRARACWIFSQFFNAKFENPANFGAGLRQVVTMMRDPDLPVRLQAAFALRYLILNKSAKDELRPLVPQILEEYFKLMSEIDNEDLVSTLETLIDRYGEEMAPYAVGLCNRLAEVFGRLYKQDDEEDPTDAPLECLVAISSLLRGVKGLPHLYQHMEPVLIPLILATMDADGTGLGYLEDSLLLTTYLTFYPPEISQNMWVVFVKMCQAANDFAIDFIENMVAPIDNFITKATAVFLNPATPYLDMVVGLYNKCVADWGTSEIDAGEACKIIESVFHNCRNKIEPRVDAILPGVVDVAVARLLSGTGARSSELKILLIETVANALYYNPILTLRTLEAKGQTGPLFTSWFQAIPKFKRFYDKKLIVLGLTSLFSVGFGQLPQAVQLGANQIMQTLLKLLTETEQLRLEKEGAKIERAAALKGDGKDEDDDDDEAEGESSLGFLTIADNEDVPADEDDDDDMEMGLFASQWARQLKGEEEGVHEIAEDGDEVEEVEVDGADFDDDDDDDDEYDDEDEDEDEDGEFNTFIDTVDELVYFAMKVHNMSQTEPQVYQQLIGALPPQEQLGVQNFMATAQKRAAAAQAAAAAPK